MNVRLVHNDNRDEVYRNVKKIITIPKLNELRIATDISTFNIDLSEVLFMQTWE